MSTLPEGWEWDYDGTRWLYRYKPSGLVQYNFPKPGDEFPEYTDPGANSFDLEPEERLASDMQMKRRDNLGGTQPGVVPSSSQRRKKPLGEVDEIGATRYFDPEGFMYLGPGGHANMDESPRQETDKRPTEMGIMPVGRQGYPNTAQVVSEPRGTTRGNELLVTMGNAIAPQAGFKRSLELSPDPLATHPSGGLNGIPGSDSTASTKAQPLGFFAELASNDTQKCADELAPIELDASQPFPGTVFSELSSDGPSGQSTKTSPTSANTNRNYSPSAPVKLAGAHPLVSASIALPPVNEGHTSSPSPSESSAKSSGNAQHLNPPTASVQENASFQAWKPGAKVSRDESVQPQRYSLMPAGSSLLEFQNRELSEVDQRRYSFPAQVPALAINRHPAVLTPSTGPGASFRNRPSLPRIGHSPTPAILRPANHSPEVPLKIPLSQGQSASGLSQDQRAHTPGSKEQHGNISSSSNKDLILLRNADLTHCPSVLKPASPRYSRPHAATISGKFSAASGPRLKASRMHDTPTQHHYDSGHPVLRMPDFPDRDTRPFAHRINTIPNQLPSQSHAPSPKRTGFGPGFVLFHEIALGKDPLDCDTTQSMEAQELSAKQQPPPVELSSDSVVPTNINAMQITPGHDQQPQATSQHGGSLQHTATQQSPSQNNSSVATPSQTHSSQSAHTNGTVHDATSSAALKPPGPPSATDASQMSQTSHETAMPSANQASDIPNSTTSGSVVKPDQSFHTSSVENATSNSANVTSYETLPLKPAPSGSQGSNTAAQNQMAVKPNFPLWAPGEGPGLQFQTPGPLLHAAPQGHGTIQGLQHSKPPSNTPSQINPQHVSMQQSLTLNTEQPSQSGSMQQLQPPPQSAQKPPVTSNANTAVTHGSIPSHDQHPNFGLPNSLPMRPNSQYSQYPSPLTQPASLVPSQISSPAASIASLYPVSSPASAYSSPLSILSSVQASPLTPGHIPMQAQHTGVPTKPPASHVQSAPHSSAFPSQQSTTVHRPPGAPQQAGGAPQGPINSIPLGPSGPLSISSPAQQMIHRPPQGTQTPFAPHPQYAASPKPHQSSGPSHVGQSTSQIPIQQPTQSQQPAQPIFQQSGNMQSQSASHTAPPQGQAIQSPTNAQPSYAYSHKPPIIGHQSVSSLTGIPQSQQANAPNQIQSPANVNPTASLSNVGQDMKKWAQKMWKSPAIQQTTAVIGGVLMAESMSGNGVAGAMAANQIYNTSQPQQPGQQPPRPQRPPHVQTAPPQSQGLPGPSPSIQSINQPVPTFQPGGVQTPGRPYADQNPYIQGAPMQMQQHPPAQAPIASPPPQGQQGQYIVNQPPPNPPYLEQPVINQQQTLSQNIKINKEPSVNTADSSMAGYYQQQQPAVIQNNQVIIDNSSTSDSYFAPPQTVVVPAASNDVNITDINVEANVNTTQYTQVDSSAIYTDNSMAATNVLSTSDNNTAVTGYNTTMVTDYNTAGTTDANFQMEAYMATDDVTTKYNTTEDWGAASETVVKNEWGAAATVTADYSGGDWGDNWY